MSRAAHSKAAIRDPGAFTLLELLVIVAIIAVIAGLLLPAISKGKHAALATECRGNLRTIGLALHMYLDERGQYPAATTGGILGFDPAYGWLMMDDWKNLLLPHAGVPGQQFRQRASTMRTLRCPQIATNRDGKRGNGQYAYNGSGTATPKSGLNLGLGGFASGMDFFPVSESRVAAPADMVAAGDVSPGFTIGEMFWTSGTFDPCSTNRALWPGDSHTGTANMLFADGHVESARQTNWIAPTEAARRRWNNDNEPHPETWQRP